MYGDLVLTHDGPRAGRCGPVVRDPLLTLPLHDMLMHATPPETRAQKLPAPQTSSPAASDQPF
jgi:hypothetical protein